MQIESENSQGANQSGLKQLISEPQDTEQGIMNAEGLKTSYFDIPCSIFKDK
jgi:hypothetical protein